MAPIPVHHTRASAAVRRVAGQLLSLLPLVTRQVQKLQVVREFLPNGRLGPPVFSDGAVRDDLDLTLSHDGPWGAAGVLFRAERSSPGRKPRQ